MAQIRVTRIVEESIEIELDISELTQAELTFEAISAAAEWDSNAWSVCEIDCTVEVLK